MRNEGRPQASDAAAGTRALRIAMSLIADTVMRDTFAAIRRSVADISGYSIRVFELQYFRVTDLW